jgi:choice-of-anchor B domain-containing protein
MPLSGGPALLPGLSFDCEGGMAGIYPCDGIDLKGTVTLPNLGGPAGNDIWGWTDRKQDRDFAIMGTTNSTAFIDVTKASNPVVVGILPTAGIPDFVLWRDIKVDGHYAFIVSEITAHGMQVFDLHRLRETDTSQPVPTVFDADANYDEISNTHNISINRKTDYAYLVGTDTCSKNGENGGLHMVDISKPLEPEFAGCAKVKTFADEEGTEPNNYVHDVECVVYRGPDRDYTGHEICFGSNENAVVIYDVTNKKKPKVISETGYDTAAYTHQGSLTKGQRFFLFGDELDEQENGQPTTTYILDVKNLDKPPVPKPYFHESASIDHNMYVHNKRVFQSNYAEGLRILRYSNRSLKRGKLTETRFFDVVPGVDVAEFAGTWSNYRFKGGKIVVSAIENAANGLFVLRPS